jgi:hypothetical protein
LGTPIAGEVEFVDCDTVLLSPIYGGNSLPVVIGNNIRPLPLRKSARYSLCSINAVFKLRD